MNELQAALDAIEHLWQAGEVAALATVVNVEGSAYRRPGARMLIAPGGARRVGSVSGGCLEGDVARKAWALTANGPALLRYDSTAEDDGLWGLGLGCRGIVQVLVERVAPGNPLPPFLRRCQRGRHRGVVATVFQSDAPDLPLGSRLLMNESGLIEFRTERLLDRLPNLAADAMAALLSGTTVTAVYDQPKGPVEVLLEVIEPPPALVIFGAGWDALPVIATAALAGVEGDAGGSPGELRLPRARSPRRRVGRLRAGGSRRPRPPRARLRGRDHDAPLPR